MDPTVDGDASDVGFGPVVLPERYADRGALGAGGMGEVRRVHDTRLGVDVAMKVASYAGSTDSDRREAFLAEARLTARLRHPAVVAVQDLGELPDGRLWFTMEIVDGRTLEDLAPELSVGRRVALLAEVAEAVAYAHAHGVVHRDLKPANLMVGEFGEARVVDWGIATQEGRGRAGAGTPAWMAPEQRDGGAVGPAADVFALGGVLRWALAPHRARDALRAIADACQETEPARRPSAAELARSLRGWLDAQDRWERADAGMRAADALRPAIEELRARSREMQARRDALAAHVFDHDPVERKRPLWALRDEADALLTRAEVQEATWIQGLRANLALSPDHRPTRERLAAYHAERLREADRSGRPLEVVRYAEVLREHDDGRWAGLVEGRGSLALDAVPPANARAWRVGEVDRRRVPVGEPVELGTTPLRVELPAGGWVVELAADGHPTARVPVFVPRGGGFDDVEPGATGTFRIPLPAVVPEGFCGVPAGWFDAGGDPDALDPVRVGRVWVDGFLLARDPVTIEEYCRFLDDAPDGSRAALLPRRAPALGGYLVERRRGAFASADPAESRHPVTGITWANMQAYVAWFREVSGLAARLPHGVEWERAARGADGRRWPIGDHLEPTATVMVSSREQSPRAQPVDALSQDVSPYGVRGLTGNVSDAMGHAWTHAGGTVREGRLVPHEPPGDGMIEVRGGSYTANAARCRAASRAAIRRDDRLTTCGFRLLVEGSTPRG